MFLHINNSAPDQVNIVMFQTLNHILHREIGFVDKGLINLRVY